MSVDLAEFLLGSMRSIEKLTHFTLSGETKHETFIDNDCQTKIFPFRTCLIPKKINDPQKIKESIHKISINGEHVLRSNLCPKLLNAQFDEKICDQNLNQISTESTLLEKIAALQDFSTDFDLCFRQMVLSEVYPGIQFKENSSHYTTYAFDDHQPNKFRDIHLFNCVIIKNRKSVEMNVVVTFVLNVE
jgi:hypothetical protein